MAQTDITTQFYQALVAGSVRVVDLSVTLSEQTPVLRVAEHFNQSWPFQKEEISRYDERGANFYWNNISCGEHTGTHFDAPIHWYTGKECENNATDTIDPQKFIAPACVIDCSEYAKEDNDFLLQPEHILAWEKENGRINPGEWVFFRTDWSKRQGDATRFLNRREDGAHTPGPSLEAVKLLADERDVLGFGSETVGTDAGKAPTFNPPAPCHNIMHGANKFGLASLTNLDQLPARGALIVANPLKIEEGSGSPCRVIALVSSGG